MKFIEFEENRSRSFVVTFLGTQLCGSIKPSDTLRRWSTIVPVWTCVGGSSSFNFMVYTRVHQATTIGRLKGRTKVGG
ncbi:hypothetical protein BDN71DRAFT_277868 [Pleurotus eryngii]|uniref:Uncharacterized protein n=1 Tax=Pleurotus eryngii TaxID=5323 RepID=A0A9P6DAJ9_PLEER|nr:hypothetical protein BDN71DRAFT_277868 [Pleurotus eryngii]